MSKKKLLKNAIVFFSLAFLATIKCYNDQIHYRNLVLKIPTNDRISIKPQVLLPLTLGSIEVKELTAKNTLYSMCPKELILSKITNDIDWY